MHILIIPSEFFDDSRRPNAGIFQFDHACLFEKKGHKVGVLALKPQANHHHLYKAVKNFIARINKQQFQECLFYFKVLLRSIFYNKKKLLNEYKINSINVVKYEGGYGFIHYKNYNKVISLWQTVGNLALKHYIKKNGKPDIIHSHNIIYGGMLSRFLSQKFSIPFTLTERSSQHMMQKMDIDLSRLVEFELGRIPFINTVSPFLGRQIENKYKLQKGSIEWLPNVVNNIFLKESTTNGATKKGNEFVFLNVANLIKLKGQEELIKAFNSSFGGNEHFKLRIGGCGVEEVRLRNLIVRLKLESQVKLLGQLSRTEVREEMLNCDLFVFPSHYETFGVVLIEALALGKPVLSTTCGGPECIVNEKNGMLVSPRNVNALTNGMKSMINNMDKYNSSEIKNDIIERFGSEAFYQRIMNLYEKAIYDYHN